MTALLRLMFFAAALAVSWDGVAAAGTLVEFPNVSERDPKLLGYLARPDQGLSGLVGDPTNRTERYPAVVVLHGCGGTSSHSAGLADKFGSWGYVGLAVDSLGPRGIANACGSGLPGQAFDAYAALRFLAAQEFVDPARIAVLGQSMGGFGVLYAIDHDMAARYFIERFRGGVAYYPGCGLPRATMTAPTLILIGDADDWTPAERCREFLATARPNGAPVTLTVYPGAHHAFDVVQLQPGRLSRGHWVEYNEPAARDAEVRLRNFLAEHLGKAPLEKPASQ